MLVTRSADKKWSLAIVQHFISLLSKKGPEGREHKGKHSILVSFHLPPRHTIQCTQQSQRSAVSFALASIVQSFVRVCPKEPRKS